MKPEKIIFMQTFPTGNYENQKLGIEIQLDDLDDPIQVYSQAKQIVNDAFNAMNPGLYIQYATPTPEAYDGARYTGSDDEPIFYAATGSQTVTQPKDPEQSIVDDIATVTDLKVLDSYKLIANKKGGRILEAYNKKLQSLQP
jgi:hypothetical protein